jgi:hypothetical protein
LQLKKKREKIIKEIILDAWVMSWFNSTTKKGLILL